MEKRKRIFIVGKISLLLLFSLAATATPLVPNAMGTATVHEGASPPGGELNLRGIAAEVRENTTAPYAREYKTIRRRYRFLEFFSLGFLLLVAIIVVTYLLGEKKRQEKARKLSAETYTVEELESPGTITSHLGRLIDEKTVFTVKFEGVEDLFSTIPTALSEREGTFHTEILSPPGGTRLLDDHPKVKIEYMFGEVLYSFITRPLSVPLSTRKHASFKSPELIKYTQRRYDYRVRPPVLEPVSALFPAPGGTRKEPVFDLSKGGFSIRTGHGYHQGTAYGEVRLVIPGKKPLKFDTTCVYVLPPDSRAIDEVSRVGFKFVNRGVKEEKALMEYVSGVRKKKDKV